MELTKEEIKRACQVASKEAEKRSEQFKPDRSVIKKEVGWPCASAFRGSVGDEIMCAITLQWNWQTGSGTMRAYQVVHVLLKCIVKQDGKRFLRLVALHKPVWKDKSVEQGNAYCLTCGDGFNQEETVDPDTSLYEY